MRTKRSEFSYFYPAALLLFYAVVTVFTVVFFSPVYAAISFFGAFCFALRMKGGAALRFCLTLCIPTVIIFTLFNLFFVHNGASVFLFVNGNPLTIESVIYGLTSGLVFSAVLLWFYTFNEVVGGDKIIASLGRMLPQIALIIAMVLRLIPTLKRNAGQISDAQILVGKGARGKGLFKKIRHGINVLSVLITLSLENGIITTNSMRARGYGAARRTYRAKSFKLRDVLLLLFLTVAAVMCIIGIVLGGGVVFYPLFTLPGFNAVQISAVALFSAVCLFPCCFEIAMELKLNSQLKGIAYGFEPGINIERSGR